MAFGRRLLPQVVDQLAWIEPSKVYASISRSTTDLSDGYRDITMPKLAAMVNRLAWWLEDILGEGNLEAIAYIGPMDIRYAVMFLAAVKCRYKMLFVSPQNEVFQNRRIIDRSGCRALIYAEEMAMIAEALQGPQLRKVIFKATDSLEHLLQTPESTEVYPYERDFDECRDEQCLILHSSGSTGEPKLVAMTHGTFACTDNDRFMPVPESRSPQNAAQFDFHGGGRFYSCFPPYHLAGVHAYIDLPIFYSNATVVFGPTSLPPSGYLLSEILKHQRVRAFYVPPFIIEQWAAEAVSSEQAGQLDFILYGGGPLSLHIGERLSQVTNVCQMYGSLEIGQVQLLVPQPGEWSYMELNPFEEVDMQPCGDGSFEMVLFQHEKFSTRRSLWHNFPAVEEWRTGDLFVPHPTKSGLWRFHGRLDDLIVLSSSHKLRPTEMETLIQGDPLLSGALIAGQGKPEPVLLVEPKIGAYDHEGTRSAFIDRIWPTIEEANKIAPSYAKINRSRVLLADPKRPFIRAPKGSVVRRLTSKAYAEEIDAAFVEGSFNHAEPSAELADTVAGFILPGVREFVRKHIRRHLRIDSLSDSDNIFAKGLDSLGAAALSRSLQRGLARPAQPANSSAPRTVTLRLVYKNPTVERLAHVILNILTGGVIPEYPIESYVEDMKRAVEDLTRVLPPKTKLAHQTALSISARPVNVAVIGPRGSLGPHIVKELLEDPRVGKIYCLNRGHDGKERMRSIFQGRKIPYNFDDERTSFMPIDLGRPRLGLSESHLDELLREVTVIIHNAWRVDFSWTLDAYRETYLTSVSELCELSSLSSLSLRIVFVSSISSVQEWAAVYPNHPVDEAPLESYNVASPLGYGQSKHVAERILSKASVASGTPVTILRVGQVAGQTDPSRGGGKWSTDEWIPSLAAISKVLRLVPADIPPIDWVPVDSAGHAIVELTLLGCGTNDASHHEQLLRVFNIVNPHCSEWSTFAGALQERLNAGEKGTTRCRQTSLAEWVDALVNAGPGTMPEAEISSSTRVLPFFQHLVETAARGIALQPKFHTAEAVRRSKAMQNVGKIDQRLIDQWLEQWGI